MLTRLLLFGALTLIFVACTPLSKEATPETRQPRSLDGKQANVKCPPNKLISNLLSTGSEDRIVWERFLKRLRGEELVEEFLRNWERGGEYTLQKIRCNADADAPIFDMDITTPQFGPVVIGTSIDGAELTAYLFIPYSHLDIQITTQ